MATVSWARTNEPELVINGLETLLHERRFRLAHSLDQCLLPFTKCPTPAEKSPVSSKPVGESLQTELTHMPAWSLTCGRTWIPRGTRIRRDAHRGPRAHPGTQRGKRGSRDGYRRQADRACSRDRCVHTSDAQVRAKCKLSSSPGLPSTRFQLWR